LFFASENHDFAAANRLLADPRRESLPWQDYPINDAPPEGK
jgi:hypothetical protein